MDNVEVPSAWSQNAVDILASRYFRKAGVPQYVGAAKIAGWRGPKWLRPSVPLPRTSFGSETSSRQVFHRIAGCLTYWGWRGGYFEGDEEQARIFYDEIWMSLALQVAVPNSPQWFNTGLHWAYGIEGPDSGMWYCEADGTPVRAPNSYERPQPHACFLTSIDDHLVTEGGIMDAAVTEARIFKYGSGSGMNVSRLRSLGEGLSGGGQASGVMSWLRIHDSAAGAIHSGGTTRRAAKMVLLEDDHPELQAFTQWKVREESKAAAMYVGSQVIRRIQERRRAGKDEQLPEDIDVPQQVYDRIAEGFEQEVFGARFEEEANRSIDGQNSNNSIRVSDRFMDLASNPGPHPQPWELTARTTGEVLARPDVKDLWRGVTRAAWACADPGLVFDDTINAWNTCAADGRIRTTNPCSEFHFLDGSACLLASKRLTAFLLPDGKLDLDRMIHVTRLWTVGLDISVSMASFPAREFAVGAWKYRTLGWGYADLGGLLMQMAIPYDSDRGRGLAAGITSLMTAVTYRTSAELAVELGPFPRWEANAKGMRRVLRNHRNAIICGPLRKFEGLNIEPPEDAALACYTDFAYLRDRALEVWDEVLKYSSFRNAQATLEAPTGTISFVMDCDTTGMEPDYALVKHKNLAGGGSMLIVNRSVPAALRRMGHATLALEAECLVGQAGPETDPQELEQSLWGLIGSHLVSEYEAQVFDCVAQLTPMAHVRMLAAIQPHLSGASSKTVNLPYDATVADVGQVYIEGWRLGVKSIALYRDGSKLAQPLEMVKQPDQEQKKIYTLSLAGVPADPISVEDARSILEGTLVRGEREHLPWRREHGYTQKAKIGDDEGQSLFWRVSEYPTPPRRPGELFIELAHEGSTMRALANCVAIAISIGLQHGVPIGKYTEQFINTKFEPAGFVEGHDHISFCQSIMDLIGRDLAITYEGRSDLSRQEQAVDTAGKIVALDRRAMVMTQGRITGELCPDCGGLLRQTGTCKGCPACGWSGGCA